MLANFINSQDENSVYGYKKQITPATKYLQTVSGGGLAFSPGEGIFSQIPQSVFTVPSGSGTNIKYVGIASNGTLDTTAPYSGNILLTYNKNTDIKGKDETGYLANTAVSANTNQSINGLSLDVRKSVTAPQLPTRPYPVDVHFRPDGSLDR
jgi:hypothetical protein